jgi:hypothetical protein
VGVYANPIQQCIRAAPYYRNQEESLVIQPCYYRGFRYR